MPTPALQPESAARWLILLEVGIKSYVYGGAEGHCERFEYEWDEESGARPDSPVSEFLQPAQCSEHVQDQGPAILPIRTIRHTPARQGRARYNDGGRSE
eukprot:CAMPEP_0202960132 /NCGR_PEP_ID=MMETSP1396-20130829/4279_1 /ASSEMBLY_ACC=CAM_ASM_000872 /TAXON_ID= /ORGANISM="Pseudokeronopsis sp., Strain Brazil" /LENGTH=98 /DNA_ID=CAMNT_0049679129 /DNA_START=114 /DNA_END=411 /DNA_ORIENTATION=+